MAKQIEHEVAYYYDSNPPEEDEVPESTLHKRLVDYLALVLQWLVQKQLATIYGNLGFYQHFNPEEKPVAPDIAVVKGTAFEVMRSWKVGITGPAPQVVFEIASQETWDKDLDEKPERYARMGVQEYFAYDPNEPPLRTGRRLYGWQLDPVTRQMHEMLPGPNGALWSPHLESFLVPEGQFLRLYDDKGQLRLTGEEAQEQAKLAETRRADAEARRADTEAQARQALAEKLRSLGIDPDQI